MDSLQAALRSPGLVGVFAARSIRARYKQTVLGFAWSLVQPLATLAIFVAFIGGLAGVDAGGGSYAAFALSTIVPWQFAAAVVQGGSGAVVAEANLVRRVGLPRLALVVGKASVAAVPLAVGLGLMGVAVPLVDGRLGPLVLWWPALAFLMAIPAMGLALLLATASVWFRDLAVGLPFLLQAMMFASPVAYPAVGIEPGLLRIYALLNPFVGPLDGFRRTYSIGASPSFELLAVSGCSGLVLLVAGIAVFDRFEGAFADVV